MTLADLSSALEKLYEHAEQCYVYGVDNSAAAWKWQLTRIKDIMSQLEESALVVRDVGITPPRSDMGT